MFRSLLIANRGEIARRVIRTARRMGLRTIAVASEADRSWPHWRKADEAAFIGEGPARESYLSIERMVAAARAHGAEAIHPGYGFLSENAGFAEACEQAGIVFVGPPPAAIRAMGSKSAAKALMARAGVAVVPGYHGERQEPDFLKQKAYEAGYPVLIKAVAGGGGRGMRRVDRAVEFEGALESARREAENAFGDGRVLVERYVASPRHIEIQVFADAHGNAVHLGERDCSLQRRHQKVVEEAPAPGMTEEVRAAMGRAAVRAAQAVGYRGAGTVEFIADASRGLRTDGFFFMEMNTRLQVEHPVTEAVTGLDLVEWQLRIAAGEELPLAQEAIPLSGHAIEARIYAEDPAAGFAPSTGRLAAAAFPAEDGVRVDSGVEEGAIVGPYYDSMLAKLIAHGTDREDARSKLASALAATRLAGPRTNIGFLIAALDHPDFVSGGVDTGFIDRNLERLSRKRIDRSLAAIAARSWLEEQSVLWSERVSGPWSRTDAFEIGGIERVHPLSLLIDGASAEASVAWREGMPFVSLAGVPADVNGRRAEIVRAGDSVFVLSEGEQLRVTIPDLLDREVGAGEGSGRVSAPMHGRVLALFVTEGDRVAKGQPLFTLEAMKMEHTIAAPSDGDVIEITVRPGDQIEEGAEAVRLERRGDAGPTAGSGDAVNR